MTTEYRSTSASCFLLFLNFYVPFLFVALLKSPHIFGNIQIISIMATHHPSHKCIVPTSNRAPHRSSPTSMNDHDPFMPCQSPMRPSPNTKNQSSLSFHHLSPLIKENNGENEQCGLQSHWSDWGSERAGRKKDARFSGSLKRIFTKSDKNGNVG